MPFSLPYIFLVLILGGLAVWYHVASEDISRRRVIAVCFLIFVFFFGFRGFIFYDWVSYYPTFQNLKYTFADVLTFQAGEAALEPGFSLLMAGCKGIYDNYQFFVLVCCLLNMVLLFRFLGKYTQNIPLALVVFLCMGGIGMSTDMMRNSISILIFANSLEFIRDRRPLPFFLLCLLGMTFHLSAILYLPMYFFLHRKLNKWIFLGIFLAANVVYLLQIPLLKSLILFIVGFVSPALKLKMKTYLEMDAGVFRLSIGYLERLFTGGLVFLYYEKMVSCRKCNTIFINCILIYLTVFLIFSDFSTVASRLSTLFVCAYWVIWLDFISCFAIPGNRMLYIVFLCLYSLLKVNGVCGNPIAEYENVLFGPRNYTERYIIFKRNYNDIKKQ